MACGILRFVDWKTANRSVKRSNKTLVFDYLTLKSKAVLSFETTINTYMSKRRDVRRDLNPQRNRSENSQSRTDRVN
jgi:hypothetical protein